MVDLAGLSGGARAFAELIAARHPDWGVYARVYEPVHPDDRTVPGSLWLEFPDGLMVLVQDTEALLVRGRREQLFVWQPAERGPAVAEEVLAAVEAARAQTDAGGRSGAAPAGRG